jgi:hypothetical protein
MASAAAEPAVPPDVIFAQASPAVVQVSTEDQRGRPLKEGSGFLVNTKGLIATNYHVVEGAQAARVILADKASLRVVGVVAFDQEADLAIIKVAGYVSAQPLELSAESLPPVGSKVYSIGNALGFANTIADGLVSGHREEGALAGLLRITMIQTTAPISHGSSGGPLLGVDGKVVGVTSLGFNEGQNVNFAVPSSHVERLLLRCENDAQPTPLPLPRRSFARLPQSVDRWPPEDVENAAHFVHAMAASNEAWVLCEKKVGARRPWLMADTDRGQFARLIAYANQEARLVRKDVLQRMHPLLANAFDDFIASTYYIPTNVLARRPDRRVQAVWHHWSDWQKANGSEIRIPDRALP